MSNTEKVPSRAELFETLFIDGAPRRQWLALIRSHVHDRALVMVPDIVDRVFDRLSMRYLESAPPVGAPARMGAYGFLHGRFGWDTGREAKAILRESDHDVLVRADGSPNDRLLADESTLDECALLVATIHRLLPRLGAKERAAFEARMACDFDAKRTYRHLRLAPGCRGAHNNAWLQARAKMAQWLAEEGWAA